MSENLNIEERLERIEKLTEENNVILRKMRRSQVWASIVRTVYWLIVLGAAGVTYYILQPYIESMLDLYGALNEKMADFNAFFGN